MHFVALAQRKFFGWERHQIRGRTVTVSDGSKTELDCADRPELAGGVTEAARIIHAAGRRNDSDTTAMYAIRFGSAATIQRLGCLRDLVGVPFEGSARDRLLDAIPPTVRTTLGREERRPGDVGYVSEWQVFVNCSKDELLSEVPKVTMHHVRKL